MTLLEMLTNLEEEEEHQKKAGRRHLLIPWLWTQQKTISLKRLKKSGKSGLFTFFSKKKKKKLFTIKS